MVKEKHGMSKTPIHYIWRRITYRCYNPKCDDYPDWGGRGIRVCDEWHNKHDCFQNFYKWSIANGYAEGMGLTLDRIDNDGDYCPTNCRWVTRRVQCNNTRKNIVYTYMGETDTLKNLCRKYDKRYDAVHNKVKYSNMPIEEAFAKTNKAFAN